LWEFIEPHKEEHRRLQQPVPFTNAEHGYRFPVEGDEVRDREGGSLGPLLAWAGFTTRFVWRFIWGQSQTSANRKEARDWLVGPAA
jgi:hypothetical protein